MKDYLQDLITHTNGLGDVDLIKVSGTDTETNINAISEKKTVIVSGVLNSPISDFIGVFGMPNLTKLKTILGFDDYDEHAKISVLRTNRDGVDVPVIDEKREIYILFLTDKLVSAANTIRAPSNNA